MPGDDAPIFLVDLGDGCPIPVFAAHLTAQAAANHVFGVAFDLLAQHTTSVDLYATVGAQSGASGENSQQPQQPEPAQAGV